MIIYLPLFIGLISNCFAARYVKVLAESSLEKPYIPLPDITHMLLLKIYTTTPDYLLFSLIPIILYKYEYLVHFDKNILCIGICTIVRSFSVFLTIFPTCMPKPNNNINIYQKYLVSTHDLMFSGHSLFFIGIGNMLDSTLIKIIGPFSLVLARQHYTIDVLVSGLVYYTVYTFL